MNNPADVGTLGNTYTPELDTDADLLWPTVAKLTATKGVNSALIAGRIAQGLPYKTFDSLVLALDSTQNELASLLMIPRSTLRRRKDSGVFHADESDRVVRYARIKDAATQLMDGDENAALDWLKTPLSVLAEKTPLDCAKTEVGARDVEQLIGRISHGVFS